MPTGTAPCGTWTSRPDSQLPEAVGDMGPSLVEGDVGAAGELRHQRVRLGTVPHDEEAAGEVDEVGVAEQGGVRDQPVGASP